MAETGGQLGPSLPGPPPSSQGPSMGSLGVLGGPWGRRKFWPMRWKTKSRGGASGGARCYLVSAKRKGTANEDFHAQANTKR